MHKTDSVLRKDMISDDRQPRILTRQIGFLALVLSVLMISGCSSMRTNRFLQETQRPPVADAFFRQLDAEVEKAEVSHQAYARIVGFPYLRTSRYLEALKNRLDSPERKKAWLQAMQALDLEAREKEIANLPVSVVQRLNHDFQIQNPGGRPGLLKRTHEISTELLTHDLQADTLYAVLVEAVEVPDDYSIIMRTFGLYPLVMPVVAYFTDNAYDKMRDRNKIPPAEQVVHGETIAYSFKNTPMETPADVRRIYAEAARDTFGLPQLSETEKLQLAQVFAPIFIHDVADTFDMPGEVTWESDQLKIDTDKPTVYYYFTPSFFQGEPILQINYVTWTSGRLGPNAPSIERGELDGITLRVSLDNSGDPFLADGINNCACYHFFIPRKDRFQEIIPISWEFDPVVIDYLPPDFPEKPIGVRITSGWHQVEDVGTSLSADRRKSYKLLPYHLLESIPRGSDESASMFDEEGVGIGSDRIEIYIFFSMGIPRVGAMRQRGRHPTKLVGRAHFDDPHLFDKNFRFK
jgi:hypothetical protein